MPTPPKYREDFHPKSFVELSNQGKLIVEICAEWGFCRDTVWRWSKDKEKKPEFVEAFKLGRECREAWFVKLGKGIATGKIKNGNVGAWIWLTKVGLGWRDDMPINFDDDIDELDFGD